MYVEADLLRARRPSFVTEAVEVFAVIPGVEGVIARGYSFLIDDVVVHWANDLDRTEKGISNHFRESTKETEAHETVAARWAEVHRAPRSLRRSLPSIMVSAWPEARARGGTHPEVNLQISRTAKLSVSNLEGDRHLIILVEDLVEAFSLMGAQLNVVRKRSGEEAQEGGEYWKLHRGR